MDQQDGGSVPWCVVTADEVLDGACLSDASENARDAGKPSRDWGTRRRTKGAEAKKVEKKEEQRHNSGKGPGHSEALPVSVWCCSFPKKPIFSTPARPNQGQHAVSHRQVQASSVWPRRGWGRISMLGWVTVRFQGVPEEIQFGSFKVTFYRTDKEAVQASGQWQGSFLKRAQGGVGAVLTFHCGGCGVEEVSPVVMPGGPSGFTIQVFLGKDGWSQLSSLNCFSYLRFYFP